MLLVESQPCFEMLKRTENLILKKGFCHLVHEMASFFTKFPSMINSALKIILSLDESRALALSHNIKDVNAEGLETLYTQSIMELCQYCPQYFT